MIHMSSPSPKISIVVPVYNTEQYLCQCLDSLINQNYNNIEIICVDDSSPDNSLSILNEYAVRDPRIKVYTKQNGGVSDTRNYGLKHISGDYYMFIDSDDWLDSGTIESCVGTIIRENADCIMFSYTKEFGQNSVPVKIFEEDYLKLNGEEIRKRLLRRIFGPNGNELKRPQDCDLTVTPCMQLFRSDKYCDISFFDIRKLSSFEDGIYQIDIYSNCERFIYLGKPFYHYRKTNTGSITTKHNPHLSEKWKNLFKVLAQKAEEYAINEVELMTFREAINNRIAVAILPLGLNEIRASKSIFQKAASLAHIINDSVYNRSINKLDTRQMPLPWKFFFFLAKKKMFKPLAIMLSVIEYVRTHYQK